MHQVDHIDHADLQVRRVPAQQVDGSQGFQRRNIATARHHHVGLAALIVAGPLPDSYPARAVLDRRVHVQPLQRGLLAGDNDIDIIAAAQAVIGDRKQAVGVRRQVDAHDVGFLVDYVIDEAGVLMAEAVVILPPDVR